MKGLVKYLAGMPMPLLLGLTALALIQLGVIVSFLIWPEQLGVIALVATIAPMVVIAGWVIVIIYEQVTDKRVGR